MENGISELKVLTNPMDSAEGILDVTICYRVAPLSAFAGFPSFEMKNSYYAHLWNGYEIPEAEMENEVVYVTENGEVYHKDRNCTHLLLSYAILPPSMERAPAGHFPTHSPQLMHIPRVSGL